VSRLKSSQVFHDNRCPPALRIAFAVVVEKAYGGRYFNGRNRLLFFRDHGKRFADAPDQPAFPLPREAKSALVRSIP
jgi:hypothetical protein